jgi:gas vesicle protein
VKGRLTAPISGEEAQDEDMKEAAQKKTSAAADKVSETAGQAKDKASSAANEAKEQSKGFISSLKQAFQNTDKEQPDSASENAKSSIQSTGDRCTICTTACI